MSLEIRRPKVGVGVFIVRNGQFVIAQRRGAHGEGTWSIPGGHLEFGETPAECAIREAREETGLRIKGVQEIGFTNDIFMAEGKHYVTVFCAAEYDGDQEPACMEQESQVTVGWTTLHDIPRPLFIPVKNFLQKGIPPVLKHMLDEGAKGNKSIDSI